MSKFVVLKL